MKKILLLLAMVLAASAFAQSNNLPDSMDQNKVPASEEAREGELIDTRDSIDLNDTPAAQEEREEPEMDGGELSPAELENPGDE